MATKLNQIIALVGGRKTAIQKMMTTIHHGWKADRVSGLTRTYQPKNDDGERFPNENKPLQVRVKDELDRIQYEIKSFWDLVATQERSNAEARGDIEISETVLVPAVPVSVLLFLEKQLTDLATLVSNVPTLPTDKVWKLDEGNRCYVAEAEQTVKTRKEQEPLVLYPATPEHPAQTQLITTDKTIGYWNAVHVSGAIPASYQHEVLRRIEALKDAVKCAREQANNIDAIQENIGEKLLSYIFNK